MHSMELHDGHYARADLIRTSLVALQRATHQLLGE